jgi:hypothetical protein
MKLKRLHFADVAKIQEAVTDELKKAQKDEFSAAFQKLHDRGKACILYIPVELILNKRKLCVFLMSLQIKKISPKTFGLQCVCVDGRIILKLNFNT